MLEAFKPNRKLRREYQGSFCCVCHMRVHALDLSLLRDERRVRAIHDACTGLLYEQAQALSDVRPEDLDIDVIEEHYSEDPALD